MDDTQFEKLIKKLEEIRCGLIDVEEKVENLPEEIEKQKNILQSAGIML